MDIHELWEIANRTDCTSPPRCVDETREAVRWAIEQLNQALADRDVLAAEVRAWRGDQLRVVYPHDIGERHTRTITGDRATVEATDASGALTRGNLTPKIKSQRTTSTRD